VPDDPVPEAAGPPATAGERDEAPSGPGKPAWTAFARRALVALGRWLWLNATVGAFGLWLLGLLFRDRWRITAVCLFVPSLFVAAALVLATVLALACRWRRLALASALLCLGPATSVLLLENRWVPPRVDDGGGEHLRLTHWNVGEAIGDWGAMMAQLKAHQPDICVLSEMYRVDVAKRMAAALGSDYRVCKLRRLAVISRGEARLVMPEDRIKGRGYFVAWSSPAGPLTLLVVDLPTSYYQRAQLMAVRERTRRQRPDIVVGDFNATRRTAALAHLPKGYAHAYDRAGWGWPATWHDRFPLWDLDQCIVGPRLRALRYRVLATGVSDHRLGVLDFAVTAPRAPGGAGDK
jgi:vancomycin resistance protein VanJ